MTPADPVQRGPLAIGGLGGSGTRLAVTLFEALGFYMGDHLNHPHDNLYFSLLFKRPAWIADFPTDPAVIDRSISLFVRAMTTGLAGQLTNADAAYIHAIGAEQDAAPAPTGVRGDTADRILASQAPDLAGHVGWGWKEPNTHVFLPWLADAIPGLRYVHVIRNGLDMAFRHNTAQIINWGDLICGDTLNRAAPHPVQSLDFWIAANRRTEAIGRAKLPGRYHLLNYDALCARPADELGRLFAFLGVRPDAVTLGRIMQMITPDPAPLHEAFDTAIFSRAQIEAVRAFGFATPANAP